MSKKSAKPAAEPKKRSKLILALAAIVPVVLAGGGYAGWTYFLQAPDTVAHLDDDDGHGEGGHEKVTHTDADHHPETDHMKVAGVPRDIAAESSFTHSYALSVLLRDKCGQADITALREMSNREAAEDGLLAQLSWEAAARRAQLLQAKSCGYLFAEIRDADEKAAKKVGGSTAHAAPSPGH
ncbi:MAG: hypothetical protein H6892_05815 [Brucellaceae bacterium]|nr:hypothetical protein [Brucellaceae bacterium]